MTFNLNYNSLVSAIEAYAERPNDTNFISTIPIFILFAQRRIARELKILGMQEYVVGTFTATSGVVTKPSRWLQTISINIGNQDGVVFRADVTAGGSLYQFPPTVTGGNGTSYNAFLDNGALSQIGVADGGTANTGTFALTITPATNDDTGSGATATATAYSGNNTRQFLLPRSYEYCRVYWPDATQHSFFKPPKYYADYDFSHWLIVPTPDIALPLEIAYYQVANIIDGSTQTNWLTDNAPDLLLYACLVEAFAFLKDPEKKALWQGDYDRAAAGFVTEDQGRVSGRETIRVRPTAAQGASNG